MKEDVMQQCYDMTMRWMRDRLMMGVVFCVVFAFGMEARASGSQPGGGSSMTGRSGAAHYHVGKAIYTGTLVPAKSVDAKLAGGQKEVLEALDAKLSESAKKAAKVSLPDLAGKLTAEQMEGLRYYLKVRYKIVVS